MKKFFLSLFLLSFVIPTHGANWKEIAEKEYIDINSIEKYNDRFQTRNNVIYSFWLKRLNDKSLYFTKDEAEYNKKIWYKIVRLLINCDNKTLAVKAFTHYGLDKSVITSYEIPEYAIEWTSIAPDTYGEVYYYGICK